MGLRRRVLGQNAAAPHCALVYYLHCAAASRRAMCKCCSIDGRGGGIRGAKGQLYFSYIPCCAVSTRELGGDTFIENNGKLAPRTRPHRVDK